jgi:hypothetical protein
VSTPLPVEPDVLPVKVLHIIHKISLLGCVLLTGLFLFYTPPDRYLSLYFSIAASCIDLRVNPVPHGMVRVLYKITVHTYLEVMGSLAKGTSFIT